jgi:hypothetical protein
MFLYQNLNWDVNIFLVIYYLVAKNIRKIKRFFNFFQLFL